jgi:hypothetical protein
MGNIYILHYSYKLSVTLSKNIFLRKIYRSSTKLTVMDASLTYVYLGKIYSF